MTRYVEALRSQWFFLIRAPGVMKEDMLRVRFGHWIPRFLRVQAIVLFPYILFADQRGRVRAETAAHEMVHARQVREHGFWRFYGLYIFFYLRNLARFRGRHHLAYRAIPFEREAYRRQAAIDLSAEERAALERV